MRGRAIRAGSGSSNPVVPAIAYNTPDRLTRVFAPAATLSSRIWRHAFATPAITNKDAKEQIEEAHHRRGRISAGFSIRLKRD